MTTKADREKQVKQHEREVLVSRTKLVLIVLCIIAIPVSWLVNHWDIGGVGDRITRIESPCLRYGSDSKICERAFEEAAASINHRMACFFQHQAGVHPPSCRGVHLRIKPKSEGGGAQSNPNTGSSPTAPSDGGSGSEGNGTGDTSPSPPSESTPTTHGNGGGGQGGGEGPANPPASTPASEQPAASESGSSESSGGGSTGEGNGNGSATRVVPEVVESTGGVVEATGEAVGGILEGAGNAGCKLLGSCSG